MATEVPKCCPECSDSPLSYTGNIVGILTFVLGLLISFAAFLAATRGADEERRRSREVVQRTKNQIMGIRDHIEDLKYQAGSNLEGMDNLIDDCLKSFDEAWRDINGKLNESKPIGTFKTGRSPMSVWDRIRWWYHEKEIIGGLARLESQRQFFATVQLAFLLK